MLILNLKIFLCVIMVKIHRFGFGDIEGTCFRSLSEIGKKCVSTFPAPELLNEIFEKDKNKNNDYTYHTSRKKYGKNNILAVWRSIIRNNF